MSSPLTCAFCELPRERIRRLGKLCLVFEDGYPVSPGHSLIIPRRHVASFFDVTLEERAELFDLLCSLRQELLERYQPEGFNVGINDGPAAGQTVMHVHVHLIPRYKGDVVDPRGGIRWILPDKADYWSTR